MTKPTDVAIKTGKTTFSSQQDAVFRFSVFPEKIWIERQATKQQWQCTVPSVDEFALKGASIPHDLVMDYLGMSLARSEAVRTSDFEVDLLGMGGDRMRLDFALKFSIAGKAWQPEYQFVLEPIEVTETQMLLAVLQEAEENLEQLRAIVPAWVVDSTDPFVTRTEKAIQMIALKGTTAWLYLCTLVKWLVEDFDSHVRTAATWGVRATRQSGTAAGKYWSLFTEMAAQAFRNMGRFLSEHCTAHA
ncbi:unnamed protein product [Hyaloperonospora brassicae]|uniref:Uncharacterized protein n=1 Tax=Hyaloperonospora brassicae TaxID=162125 RepID=A0AAV0U4A1_HYABA|nr:unnamed protein product [Hyaloperonospora brassicae]